MIKIFKNRCPGGNGEIVVQSDHTSVVGFWDEFAIAYVEALQSQEGDQEFFTTGAFGAAWNIALKIAGYKSENVHERVLLTCGYSDPVNCNLLVEKDYHKPNNLEENK